MFGTQFSSCLCLIAISWVLPVRQTKQEVKASKRADLVRRNQERLRFSEKAWHRYLVLNRKLTPVSFFENNENVNQEVQRLRQEFLRQNLVETLIAHKLTRETPVRDLPNHLVSVIEEILAPRRAYRGVLGDLPPIELSKTSTVRVVKQGKNRIVGKRLMTEQVQLRANGKVMILAARGNKRVRNKRVRSERHS